MTRGLNAPMFSGVLRALSNHAPGAFYVPDLDATAPTGEHAFNALKTLDAAARDTVLAAPSPGETKRRGRSVPLRPGWDTGVRVWAMTRVLVAKFSTEGPAATLLWTGDMPLVETNTWHDQFWGDCFCPRHVGTPGVNMLGELLMAQRTHLTLRHADPGPDSSSTGNEGRPSPQEPKNSHS